LAFNGLGKNCVSILTSKPILAENYLLCASYISIIIVIGKTAILSLVSSKKLITTEGYERTLIFPYP